MSELCPKLKLKRKKSSADPELPSARKQRSFTPGAGSESAGPRGEGPETPTTSAPASASASACSGEDRLWALTLCWVLQEVQDTLGMVPELPSPSAMTPPTCSAAAHWDLTNEVPPLPEYATAQMCSNIMTDGSKPSQDTPVPPLSPKTHPSSQTPHTSDLQMQTETHRLEAVLPQSQRDRRTPRGRVGTETQGPKTTVRTEASGTGELMPSCPMCLLVFPLGFTQLDRDGHLAQCLSEVNIDVTW